MQKGLNNLNGLALLLTAPIKKVKVYKMCQSNYSLSFPFFALNPHFTFSENVFTVVKGEGVLTGGGEFTLPQYAADTTDNLPMFRIHAPLFTT